MSFSILKRNLILPLIILSLYSCYRISKIKFNYINNTNNSRDTIELNLSKFSNFLDLYDTVDNNLCNKINSIITFENDSAVYRFTPIIQYCSSGNPPIRDYWASQFISLSADSILVDASSIYLNKRLVYSMDSLDIILSRHLLNKFNFRKSYRTKFVAIAINSSKAISATKRVFQNLITSFNKLNKQNKDTLNLYIFLRRKFITIIPSPPMPKFDDDKKTKKFASR